MPLHRERKLREKGRYSCFGLGPGSASCVAELSPCCSFRLKPFS